MLLPNTRLPRRFAKALSLDRVGEEHRGPDDGIGEGREIVVGPAGPCLEISSTIVSGSSRSSTITQDRVERGPGGGEARATAALGARRTVEQGQGLVSGERSTRHRRLTDLRARGMHAIDRHDALELFDDDRGRAGVGV